MTLLLATHIISALITLAVCALAWFRPSLINRNTILVLTLLSLGSGVILALDPNILKGAFCLKFGLYLLFIALTLSHLHAKLTEPVQS